MTVPIWTWSLKKGAEPGTVEIFIRDEWGWTVTGTGTLQPDKTYAGTATVGDKGVLHIPFVDEAP